MTASDGASGCRRQNSFIIAELKGIFEFVEVEVRIHMDGMVVLSLERPN
jgi:hypothetical protein